jgi:serine/threonine protein kinase
MKNSDDDGSQEEKAD